MSDPCLSLFGAAFPKSRAVLPHGARILEIGCAEADWMTPMLARRPDVSIVGVDWRACERPGLVIQGDILAQDFGPHAFDAVMGISSIEHIGLGHYDGDPLDVDGDRHCMEKVASWLVPGGLVYLDVPYCYDGYEVRGTEYRVYDEAAIASRLTRGGLYEEWRAYASLTAPTVLQTEIPRSSEFWMVALVLRKPTW